MTANENPAQPHPESQLAAGQGFRKYINASINLIRMSLENIRMTH